MKRLIVLVAIATVYLSFGLSRANAQDPCTNPNSILSATYAWLVEDGLIASGAVPGPTVGDFVPFATAGVLTFDGNGEVSGAHDTDFGGTHFHLVDSGTYRVNADCATGTISLTSDGITLGIVITGGGQEIKFTSSTPGRVFAGSMPLVATGCSTGTLSGSSYGYATQGLLVASLAGRGVPRIGGFVSFSNTGQIAFNADGSVSGIDNVNLGGAFFPALPIEGTYVVNSDCTGTATLTITGIDHSWSFVILQEASQIIFVATPSGFVWSGILTKQ